MANTLARDPRKIVRDVATIIGGEVRADYSGRGMNGKTCFGIVCDDPDECVEEAASYGLRGARRDGMGTQYIVYWPSVT